MAPTGAGRIAGPQGGRRRDGVAFGIGQGELGDEPAHGEADLAQFCDGRMHPGLTLGAGHGDAIGGDGGLQGLALVEGPAHFDEELELGVGQRERLHGLRPELPAAPV